MPFGRDSKFKNEELRLATDKPVAQTVDKVPTFQGWAFSIMWVVTLSSSQSVRDINHPLCGCAVFVIQKKHLSVIMRLFKPIYNEGKGDFNGQKGK